MERPLVSIIMPVYNREKLVGESIRSVLSQTFGDFQFIIVDDGSTDSSWEVISSFEDERIEAVKNPANRHIAHATNCAFERVKGEYIAFIDSDDLWAPEKLEKQLAFMKQHPEYACCFTHVNLIDENGGNVNEKYASVLALYNAENASREEWLRYFFFKGNRLPNTSALFRTEVVKSIGGLNACFVQAVDMDFWVRMTLKFSFAILPEKLLFYRWEDSSDVKMSIQNNVNHTRFYNEHAIIRHRLLNDMDEELFVRTFKKDFVRAEAEGPYELACERLILGLTTISDNRETVSAYGLMELYKALGDRKTADVLAEKYAITSSKIAELTGRHILNDPYIAIEHVHERDMLLQNERIKTEHWKKEYEDVISSKTWQTATKLKNLFKK